jgi:hypothetical protein
MKTIKIYAILGLIMFFSTVTLSFADGINNFPRQPFVSGAINYQVNVDITYEKPLCNIYLIEIRDGNGVLVAPAQRYISGVSQYNFKERGPASGVRVAILKRAIFGDHFVCLYELFTPPVVICGPFQVGQTYRFDLIPSWEPSKE